MNILFIGGTGIISSACSALAVARGMHVFHLNRGNSIAIRPAQGVTTITADIRNFEACQQALAPYEFDVVVDFISFVPEHIEQNITLFRNKTKQYIFISSASIYQTPPQSLPVTELTPRENPVWEYSRNKIACEDVLLDAFSNHSFPAVIVRPSHTYDQTLLPIEGGYTVLHRILHNKPIVIHGDGSSIWTLTHARDFAKGLVGLFGNTNTFGEAFHITSDEWLTWNQIYEIIGKAVGKTPEVVYMPSTIIATYNKEIGDSLLGDKTHSMIFNNSKIKQYVPDFSCEIPFSEGVHEIINFYTNTPSFQLVNNDLDALFDVLIQKYKILFPQNYLI